MRSLCACGRRGSVVIMHLSEWHAQLSCLWHAQFSYYAFAWLSCEVIAPLACAVQLLLCICLIVMRSYRASGMAMQLLLRICVIIMRSYRASGRRGVVAILCLSDYHLESSLQTSVRDVLYALAVITVRLFYVINHGKTRADSFQNMVTCNIFLSKNF